MRVTFAGVTELHEIIFGVRQERTALTEYALVCGNPPLRAAEQRRRAGGSRRGLFESSRAVREGEFRSRPARRVAQGSPLHVNETGEPGATFFGLLFLAGQEK